MAKLRVLKPRVQTLKASRVQTLEGTKRISGNSLYAIMKRFERMHPAIWELFRMKTGVML